MRILAGQYKGHRLFTPKGKNTRPPLEKIRHSIFSTLGEETVEANVLDLFAGCGSLGLEALSRWANQITFVEKEYQPLTCLKRNIKKLNASQQCHVLPKNVFQLNPKHPALSNPFHLVFLDPPYPTLNQPNIWTKLELLLQKLHWTPEGLLIARHPSNQQPNWNLIPLKQKIFGQNAWSLWQNPTPIPCQ